MESQVKSHAVNFSSAKEFGLAAPQNERAFLRLPTVARGGTTRRNMKLPKSKFDPTKSWAADLPPPTKKQQIIIKKRLRAQIGAHEELLSHVTAIQKSMAKHGSALVLCNAAQWMSFCMSANQDLNATIQKGRKLLNRQPRR